MRGEWGRRGWRGSEEGGGQKGRGLERWEGTEGRRKLQGEGLGEIAVIKMHLIHI